MYRNTHTRTRLDRRDRQRWMVVRRAFAILRTYKCTCIPFCSMLVSKSRESFRFSSRYMYNYTLCVCFNKALLPKTVQLAKATTVVNKRPRREREKRRRKRTKRNTSRNAKGLFTKSLVASIGFSSRHLVSFSLILSRVFAMNEEHPLCLSLFLLFFYR